MTDLVLSPVDEHVEEGYMGTRYYVCNSNLAEKLAYKAIDLRYMERPSDAKGRYNGGD
jgi:hypothetical protein